MTNKEAVEILASKYQVCIYGDQEECDRTNEALDMAIKVLELVTINTDSDEIKVTNCNYNDLISRQAAIDSLETDAEMLKRVLDDTDIVGSERDKFAWGLGMIESFISDMKELPSAQPEQRCVNCGRTINNGGWYKDGRTRCPIEEHYALPKDGYCHLWEKRKVWEDDYVKRPEEGEK